MIKYCIRWFEHIQRRYIGKSKGKEVGLTVRDRLERQENYKLNN